MRERWFPMNVRRIPPESGTALKKGAPRAYIYRFFLRPFRLCFLAGT